MTEGSVAVQKKKEKAESTMASQPMEEKPGVDAFLLMCRDKPVEEVREVLQRWPERPSDSSG